MVLKIGISFSFFFSGLFNQFGAYILRKDVDKDREKWGNAVVVGGVNYMKDTELIRISL